MGAVNTNLAKSWTRVRFLPLAIVAPNGDRPVNSDADRYGAPDHLEFEVGIVSLVASRDAVRTALGAGRALQNIALPNPDGGIKPATDSHGDGVPDLEELSCGSNRLDRFEQPSMSLAFPDEPR